MEDTDKHCGNHSVEAEACLWIGGILPRDLLAPRIPEVQVEKCLPVVSGNLISLMERTGTPGTDGAGVKFSSQPEFRVVAAGAGAVDFDLRATSLNQRCLLLSTGESNCPPCRGLGTVLSA